MWVVPSAYKTSEMKVTNEESDIPCLYVYTPRKSFVLEFSTQEENKEWFNVISRVVLNARISEDNMNEDIPFAPIWMPDKTTHVCTICKQEHTFFVRRHHCRACGCVACANCLRYRAIVKGVSSTPVRVCYNCYVKITQKEQQQQQTN